jgi:Major Facilitator Superfamily
MTAKLWRLRRLHRGWQHMLLADRDVRRWLLASRLGSAAEPLASLALLLAGKAATGSFVVGALMAGAFQVATAVAAPWQGRRLDRRALPAAFRAPLLGQAAAALLLAAAAAHHATPVVLVVLSVALGACAAGLEGGYRALVGAYLRPEIRAAAYSYDAAFQEGEWLLGPAVVGAVALVAPAWAALLVIAAVALAAVLAGGLLPGRLPSPATARARVALWRIRPAQRVLLLSFLLGVTFGVTNAAGPALLESLGVRAALWGPVTLPPTAASMVGGLTAARIRQHRWLHTGTRRALALFGLYCVGITATFVASRSLLGVLGILTLAGMWYAPLAGVLRQLLAQALPQQGHAEGFATESALSLVGAGVGAGLLAWLLAILGPRLAVVVVVGPSLAAAAAATLPGSGSARPPGRMPP